MTNGEKLIEIFPNNSHISLKRTTQFVINPMTINQQMIVVDNDFWNAEYKESTTKNDLVVDCISREQAVKTIQRYGVGCFDTDEFSPEECERFVIAKLNELPPVKPQPRKGHWIEHPHEAGACWEYSRYECSECHDWAEDDSDFCPHCGAKMVEPQESE